MRPLRPALLVRLPPGPGRRTIEIRRQTNGTRGGFQRLSRPVPGGYIPGKAAAGRLSVGDFWAIRKKYREKVPKKFGDREKAAYLCSRN